MKIQLLGPVRVETDEGEAVPIGGPKQRTVLARLAVEPGRAVSLDQLSEAVWGQTVPQRAHRSLATYASNLRREAHLPIDGESGAYTLAIDRSCVDLCVFEDAIANAGPVTGEPEAASTDLRAALDLFQGEPLADVNQQGAFTAETIRIADMKLTAIERAIEAELEAGRHDQAVSELTTLVEENPDREHLRGLHMRALYSSGRQTDALKAYQTYRLRLQELGLDPAPELQNLELAILRHDDSLTQPARTMTGDLAHRHLPARYSTFVGRQEEIQHVRASLDRRRLITIVGPGGIGKSSIALEAVRGATLPSECVVVRTAFETIDEGAVGFALAEAIGLQPAGDVDPVDLAIAYIEQHHYLLVLDGCEAHPAEIGSIINRLLLAAPNSRVVATSRVPLMLPGERIVRVEGLPMDDAVQLFADRADLDTPLDESVATTVASVCDALDGMALAIELAAARARSIPLDQLEQRVERQMPLLRRSTGSGRRHDSMARAIQWSTDLLTEAERQSYRRLSVFSTGFRLRDASGVLGSEEDNDIVARLVEVSLLQPADANGEYRYLEPIRQHAVQNLDEAGERDIAHEAHAQWMVEAARSAFLDEWSPRRRAMRSWLFRRRNEFLEAVRWSSENGQPDLAIGIFASIGKIIWSFEDIGHILGPMVRALDDPAATRSPDLAIALADTAWAFKAYDRPEEAQAFVERAEAIIESFDDASPEELRAKGTVLARRAILQCPEVVIQSDLELAEQAIRLLEQAQAPNAGSFAINRANLLYRLHGIAEANQLFEDANAWYLATTGRPSPLSLNHRALVLALRDGEWDRALDAARTAAQIQLDEHDNLGAIGSYYIIGYLTQLTGRSQAEPVQLLRHMERITGTQATFMIEMWYRSELGETTSVMRLAKRWLKLRTWHRVDNFEYLNDDPELNVYGDERTLPRFFTGLIPVARALESAGRIDDARYLVREIPSLIEQAKLKEWGTFDFLSLFADIAVRLDVGEPHGVTLEQMFDWVRNVIETFPTTGGPHVAFAELPEERGAPPMFTRIRDV